MTRVAIIDYGVGNLRSVEKAFGATGCAAVVSADESVLRNADRLVLPGVGAFGACMNALTERGFDELVRERVAAGTPLLGVCVGMQMLFEESGRVWHDSGPGTFARSCSSFLRRPAGAAGWVESGPAANPASFVRRNRKLCILLFRAFLLLRAGESRSDPGRD